MGLKDSEFSVIRGIQIEAEWPCGGDRVDDISRFVGGLQ